MPSPSNRDADALIARARTALANARLPDVAPLLADYGYDDVALDEGDALLATAESAAGAIAREYSEQYAATDARAALEAETEATLGRLSTLARAVYPAGTEGHTRLNLAGRRPQASEAFARHARTFYQTLQADDALRAPLERRRVTLAALTDALARLDALDVAIQRQAAEAGEAQQATAARNTAVARLQGWMREFAATAKMALAEHPQLRERLGLRERGS